MRWRRGLFRVWVVASVCWIALVSALTYSALHNPALVAARQKARESACAAAREADRSLGNPYDCFSYPAGSKPPPEPPEPMWPVIAPYAALGLGVPAGVLVLGSMAIWAAAGFRREGR